jgi:hypothetical protein
MNRGTIVARKGDPVHAGRVVRFDRTRDLVNVRWFGACDVLEFMIPAAELQPAVDWKGGQSDENEQAQMQRRLKGKQ